jgi:hypothetical protein
MISQTGVREYWPSPGISYDATSSPSLQNAFISLSASKSRRKLLLEFGQALIAIGEHVIVKISQRLVLPDRKCDFTDLGPLSVSMNSFNC